MVRQSSTSSSDEEEALPLLPAARPAPVHDHVSPGVDGKPATEQEKEEGIAALLRVPRYPLVFVAGLLFDFARIGMAFIGPFYVNATTQSPRLVQLTGSATWAFLLAGPCFGLLSDRFDRRRTVLAVLMFELSMSVVMGVLLRAEIMHPGFMFVYMLFSSICMVLDTTNRPALVYDLLHSRSANHMLGTAMALRSVGGSIGKICGNQVVGYVIEKTNVATACLFVSALLSGALVLLCFVPSPPKASDKSGGLDADKMSDPAPALGVMEEISAGVSMAWRDRSFMSMLGVTMIGNFFYWSHLPLLQVLATNLHATPSEAGLLVSASGWGSLFASIYVAKLNPRRTGVLYCTGIFLANVALPGATLPYFWVAFGAVATSGFLAGLFGAVQSALVMSMVRTLPTLQGARAVGDSVGVYQND